MDPAARRGEVVSDLLERSRMSDAEVARRAALAADEDYWRGLTKAGKAGRVGGAGEAGGAGDVARLTIGAVDTALPSLSIDDRALRAAIEQFQDYGYFQTPTLLAGTALASLNVAIDALTSESWPPAFAWVYDQFWECARLPALVRVMEARLGCGYRQIPHVWVHVVPPASGATGWTPHFDRGGRQSRRASAWLALTAATLDNGCMHLVPRPLLPESFRRTSMADGLLPASDALRALHAARALPAPAGGALGWDFDILHWGGPCLNPGEARRAISMEFIVLNEPPEADETPLVAAAGPLPAFAERLRLIGRAIHAYEKFEPGLVRYRGLAERLRAP